ncbi:hypothetical protein WCX18_04350 [Sulfurimonas sp. HSL1-2]|uniref:hypothetical protein n=1 Tax=Thiomicrolovo zhangzhouensis TaxID=3131933 RepID=UPI0031F99925
MDKAEALKEKILKAQEAADIAGLYVLEQEANECFDEQTLIAYYANILDLALENLTDALGTARRMQMTEVKDFATLRALYEYAVEHYSAGKASDAAALFEILAGLSDDARFSEAMTQHQSFAERLPDFGQFLDDAADLEATQRNGTFYISAFRMDGNGTDES